MSPALFYLPPSKWAMTSHYFYLAHNIPRSLRNEMDLMIIPEGKRSAGNISCIIIWALLNPVLPFISRISLIAPNLKMTRQIYFVGRFLAPNVKKHICVFALKAPTYPVSPPLLILRSWCFVWLLFYLLSKRIWCKNHLSMYTTHGGFHLTSLYCNKEEIQFVKYHRTACISHQIIRARLQKSSPESA